MPTPPIPTPAPAAGASDPAAVGNLPILQEILTALKGLQAAIQPPVPTPAPAGDPNAAGADAAGGAGGGEDQLSDEELERLLAEGDEGDGTEGGTEGDNPDDASRKGKQPPVQNSAAPAPGQPSATNTHVNGPTVKLSKELAEVRNELARMKLSKELASLRQAGIDVDENDQELISDLAAQPEDMRKRNLDRLKKNSRRVPVNSSFNFEAALHNATDGSGGKRVVTREDQQKVMKLARSKGISYEAAGAELGFTIGG